MRSQRARANTPEINTDPLTPEQEEQVKRMVLKVKTAHDESVVMERAALRDLDTSLALKLKELLPVAVRQSQNEKKPDSRLLRLIVRYTAAKNRQLANTGTLGDTGRNKS
jgi:hypothetical protein